LKHHKRVHPEWLVQEPVSGFRHMEPYLQEATSSGHVAAILNELFKGVAMPAQDDTSAQRLLWAGLLWTRSGMPIYRMEPELQEMLLNTAIPDTVETLPRLPLPCIYLACDRFKIWNRDTGMHESEGVYVMQDKVRRTVESSAEDGLMFISVGKSRKGGRVLINPITGEELNGEMARDDALAWGSIIPNADLTIVKNATPGFQEGVRLALNFLLLWNATGRHLEQKKVRPKVPPSGKKLKRFHSQHKSATPFYLVTLRNRAAARGIRKAVSNWDGPIHEVLISGFWQRVWKKDPEDAQVVATKINAKGTTLCCVWKYIGPHPAIRRGEAKKTARNYNVR